MFNGLAMSPASTAPSPFARLKVALVADELTSACLAHECRIMQVTPRNAAAVLRLWRPDILFVESCWNGWRGAWKYGIAAYPDHPERDNHALQRTVGMARERGIPTVFWNREDGVHFDRFIASARLFDAIFTVDETVIPRYREVVGPGVLVGVLMFAFAPAIHHPAADLAPIARAAFAGSYSRTLHARRRSWQHMMFDAAEPLGLTIFDRNSGRRAETYRFASSVDRAADRDCASRHRGRLSPVRGKPQHQYDRTIADCVLASARRDSRFGRARRHESDMRRRATVRGILHGRAHARGSACALRASGA